MERGRENKDNKVTAHVPMKNGRVYVCWGIPVFLVIFAATCVVHCLAPVVAEFKAWLSICLGSSSMQFAH